MTVRDHLYAQALDAANVGIWRRDMGTNQLTWSNNIERLFGLEKGSFDGSYEAFMALLPVEDRQRLVEAIGCALKNRQPFEIEYRSVWPNGAVHWYLGKANLVCDTAGNVTEMIGTKQDITDRKLAELALRDSRELLSMAQAIGNIGSWTWDVAGGRIVWSPQMYKIYGFAPDGAEVNFENAMAATHPDDRAMVNEKVQALFAGKDFESFENRLVHPNGETRYVWATTKVQRDGEGRVVGMIGTVQDVTDRERDARALRDSESRLRQAMAEIQKLNAELEQRVRERTAQLEAANRELEAFCYSISHDLRAPLRAIDGFAHVLMEDYAGKLDAAGEEHLNRVRSGAQHMSELIDDLLDLSRLNRAALSTAEVDLSALTHDVLAQLAAAAPERDVRVNIAPGITARGDPRLLRVALTNLLDNAWKYTGKIPHARIEFGEERKDHERVFYVRDNGAGFEMQFAGKLFGPFQRLHNVRDFPGTGIGLATVARIVHRHGGRVWAEATPGEGAVFYFTLPQQ